jgi:prepilin-type processing-associated H-X9-DG protein
LNLLACFVLVCLALALIFPAIHGARESARRLQCSNNIRSFGIGFSGYHDTFRAFPYGCVGNPELPPEKRWSWYLCVGIYMGHYGSPIVDLDKPWDAEELRPLMLHTWSNGQAADVIPDSYKNFCDYGSYQEYDIPLRPFLDFRCPNGPDETHDDGQPFASYVGMGGVGPDAPTLPEAHERAGAWAYDRQIRICDIADGNAATIFLIETSHENGCWIAGGAATVRGADSEGLESLPYVRGVGHAGQFGGYHPRGCSVMFVDGHYGFINESTDPSVFESLCTGWGSDGMKNVQE